MINGRVRPYSHMPLVQAVTYLMNIVMYTPVMVTCLKMYTESNIRLYFLVR